MYPDGGIARFRVYGLVSPIFPEDPKAELDLAHVFSGGRVVKVSDQHFGTGSNLLLPGRGEYQYLFISIYILNNVSQQERTWGMAGRRSEAGHPDISTGP